MNACHNLTERSLTELLTSCEKIDSVLMRACDVGFVYFPEEITSVAMKLEGCPLISPPDKYREQDTSLLANNEYLKGI